MHGHHSQAHGKTCTLHADRERWTDCSSRCPIGLLRHIENHFSKIKTCDMCWSKSRPSTQCNTLTAPNNRLTLPPFRNHTSKACVLQAKEVNMAHREGSHSIWSSNMPRSSAPVAVGPWARKFLKCNGLSQRIKAIQTHVDNMRKSNKHLQPAGCCPLSPP